MIEQLVAWLARPLVRLALIVAAVIALVLLINMAGCSHDEVQQARQDGRSADALARTAKEAAETVVARAEKDADLDALVAATAQEIDNAQTPQAADAAARAAICSMSNYRNDPDC